MCPCACAECDSAAHSLQHEQLCVAPILRRRELRARVAARREKRRDTLFTMRSKGRGGCRDHDKKFEKIDVLEVDIHSYQRCYISPLEDHFPRQKARGAYTTLQSLQAPAFG